MPVPLSQCLHVRSDNWSPPSSPQASPHPGLDPLISQFTGYTVKKVPIIRIFGSSPAGQRACIHLHGVFPYFYVPLPPNQDEGFIYRLAASLNKAINLSLNQAQAKIEHVYKAVKVKMITNLRLCYDIVVLSR